jgi:hypothetical protein
MSTILEVRASLMITLNCFIVIIFCVAGQVLLNEASNYLPCDRKKKIELAVTKNFSWQSARFQLTDVSLKS